MAPRSPQTGRSSQGDVLGATPGSWGAEEVFWLYQPGPQRVSITDSLGGHESPVRGTGLRGSRGPRGPGSVRASKGQEAPRKELERGRGTS